MSKATQQKRPGHQLQLADQTRSVRSLSAPPAGDSRAAAPSASALLNGLDGPSLLRVLESLSDGAYIVDRFRRVLYWNPAAEAISGYPAGTMTGSCCDDRGLCHIDEHGTSLCSAGCPLMTAMATEDVTVQTVYLHHRKGHRVHVQVRVHPLKDQDGHTVGAVELFSSRSPATIPMHEMEKLAFLDPLTGIGNRRHLERAIAARLADLDRYGWSFGVIFLDVDNLKDTNDCHGHDAGDQLLRTVASTLECNVRTSDVVGRWGGDEFVVAAAGATQKELSELATKLCTLIQHSSHRAKGASLQATVSAGVKLASRGDTVESLIRETDRLMYRSKTAGGNRCSAMTPSKEA